MAKNRMIDKDWVDAYFDHGVDVENRRVWLVGDISEDSADKVIKGLYLMDTVSNEPCELFLSSNGGDVAETKAICDIIHTLKCPVHTFGFGKVMSAAPSILACGKKGERWVSTHCEFMLHDWTGGNFDGRGAELRADLEQGERSFEQLLRILAENSDKNYAHWKRLTNKTGDFYFDAGQAVEWGLADHIWSEKST